MSNRDRKLLATAGLSVPKVADLFSRSHQAIYQGLNQVDRDYFSVHEAVIMLDYALRKDVPSADLLKSFILTNYKDAPKSPRLLREDIDLDRLGIIAESCESAIVVANGFAEHITSEAIFLRALQNVSKVLTTPKLSAETSSATPIHLLVQVPNNWLKEAIRSKLSEIVDINRIAFDIDQSNQFTPSYIVFDVASGPRAFMFGRMSIEELLSAEAKFLYGQSFGEFGERFSSKVATHFASIPKETA